MRHCVAVKVMEMAPVLVLRFLIAPGEDIYTMFLTQVKFPTSWGISVAVAGCIVGTSQLRRVPQLKHRELYTLVEYMYSTTIFPIFLAATGFATLADLSTCLLGAGLPILVLVRGRSRFGALLPIIQW